MLRRMNRETRIIKRESRNRERRAALAHDLDAYRAAGFIAHIAAPKFRGETFVDAEIEILAPCGKWITPTMWGRILDTSCPCYDCVGDLD